MGLLRRKPPRGPAKSYGPRIDAETGAPHMRVADAVDYQVKLIAWERTVGNGKLRCEILKGHKGGAMRLTRLVADYSEAGNAVLRSCICRSEQDEARDVERLTNLMVKAALTVDGGAVVKPEELRA